MPPSLAAATSAASSRRLPKSQTPYSPALEVNESTWPLRFGPDRGKIRRLHISLHFLFSSPRPSCPSSDTSLHCKCHHPTTGDLRLSLTAAACQTSSAPGRPAAAQIFLPTGRRRLNHAMEGRATGLGDLMGAASSPPLGARCSSSLPGNEDIERVQMHPLTLVFRDRRVWARAGILLGPLSRLSALAGPAQCTSNSQNVRQQTLATGPLRASSSPARLAVAGEFSHSWLPSTVLCSSSERPRSSPAAPPLVSPSSPSWATWPCSTPSQPCSTRAPGARAAVQRTRWAEGCCTVGC